MTGLAAESREACGARGESLPRRPRALQGRAVSVYVDDYRVPARVGRINARWSHLMADTLPELLAFADQLGLQRRWLQDKASGVHFDVTDSKREEALRLGAIPLHAGDEQWRRALDEARQQFTGQKRPRRFPLPAEDTP